MPQTSTVLTLEMEQTKPYTITVSKSISTHHEEKRDTMLSFVKTMMHDLATCAEMIDRIVAKGQL